MKKDGPQDFSSAIPESLLSGAKTEEERDRVKVAFWDLAQMSPDTLGGRLAVLLSAHANAVQDAADRQAAATQANPEVLTAIKGLEKRLQKPAVLADAYEEPWERALRFGLKFCLAPVLAAGLAWWFTSSHDLEEAQATAQRMAQTPAAILQQNLDAMRTQISWSVSPDQRILTLRVVPSADPNAWRLVGNGSITLAAPPSTASAGPDTRHR